MAKPKIVKMMPAMLDVSAGTHKWCACGECGPQPYADSGGCKAGFEAVEFKVTLPKRLKLCLCKHTKKAPYCDGAHCGL